MTQYLSEKLRNLSAVSILMVLYIHMYYVEGTSMVTLGRLEKFIGSGICSVAVPMFYIISGYFFFLNIPNGMVSIRTKIRKRVRTLLVPYLIANVFTFTFYVCLNVVSWYAPTIDKVVNFKVLDIVIDENVWSTLKLIFIDPPIAFQLWFVRDLMVAVAFSPVLWLIIKNCSNTPIKRLVFQLCLLSIFVLFGKNGYCAAFIWFTTGGFIAEAKFNVSSQDNKVALFISTTVIYIGMTVYCCCLNDSKFLTRYIPLFGIPALWYGYEFVHKYFQSIHIQKLVKYTFFIYLIHEPLLNIFKKIPLLVNRSEPMMIVYYLTIPIIFYLLACRLGCVLKKYTPKIYAIYTGGR